MASTPQPPDADQLGQQAASLIEQARALQEKALAGAQEPPGDAQALYRGALDSLAALLRLRPRSAQAHRLRGVAHLELGELAAAREAFAEAHRLAPEDPRVAADLAAALLAGGDAARATAVYEQALRAHPQDAALHAGLALALLGAGDFERGWEEYEWRLAVPGAASPRPLPLPRWRGEPLAGKTLFIASEQGIGDEIMFASCFGELIEAARLCVIEASRRLAPLVRRSFPRARVVERNLSTPHDLAALPPIDFYSPAGSLPRWLRRRWQDFPRHAGYLKAMPERVEHWKARLGELGPGPRVGLAWTGGLAQTLRAARSLTPQDLRPLLERAGVRFVALERSDPGPALPWWAQAAGDLDELAGLLCALELTVSVTTATAHLSAALGRPTWILIPAAPTWRYGWSGERIAWYPAARVLRNAPGAPPRALLERVARELAEGLL